MPQPPEFNIYPELDRQLAEAMGDQQPAESELGSAVQKALEHSAVIDQQNDRQDDLEDWAYPRIEELITTWSTYKDAIAQPTTESLESNPSFWETLDRLEKAQQTLVASSELASDGQPIHNTMQLILVPWQSFKDNLPQLYGWLIQMNSRANRRFDYSIEEDLLKMLKEDKIYRNPENSYKPLISTNEYLDKKIAHDGPWGVMLAQTSSEAGAVSLKGQNLMQLTDYHQQRMKIDGQPVGSMGALEWLALTLQTNPKTLSNSDQSLLPANLLKKANSNGGIDQFGVYGLWLQTSSLLPIPAGTVNDFLRPRLAIA